MLTMTAPKGYTPAQIKAIRLRLGLTQTQAAEKVGVTIRSWQSWESGKYTPNRPSMLLIGLLAKGQL